MNSYSCDICGKEFSREDNLREHRKKHDLYQCPHCPQAFGSEINFENPKQRHHAQTGGGTKRKAGDDEGPISKRRLVSNPQEHYTITPSGEQRMRKFNTTAKRYKIDFKDLEVTDLPSILTTLHRLFLSVIKELTGFMDPADLVRLTIHCPELDFPISLPFMRVSRLTADQLLSEIERVLQSYEEFVIDQSLEIELVHVRLPSGAGRKRPLYVDLERTMTEKRCFIKINNKDQLCCARAIVTAKAKIDQHSKWNSIRLGKGMQKQLAEELHKMADVPLRRCDLEDGRKFQTVLNDYQIHVISKESFNGIVFKGPEADKKIYPLSTRRSL